jgi:hypothetical protein
LIFLPIEFFVALTTFKLWILENHFLKTYF